MKKIFYFLIFCYSLTFAQLSNDAGKTYFNFLNIFPSPAISSLGKMSVTEKNVLNSYVVNPALLTSPPKEQKYAEFFYSNLIEDISLGNINSIITFKNKYPLAISASFVNYGSIVGRDELGERTGDLSASDLSLSFSSALKLNKQLSVGAALTFVYSTLDGSSATGIAMNTGFFYQSLKYGRLGLSLLHLGIPMSKFNSNDEAMMPTTIAFGWSNELAHLPAEPHVTLSKSNGGDLMIHSGLVMHFTPALTGRLGYYSSLEDEISFSSTENNKNGFTFGLDLSWKTFKFNFAMYPFAKIGTVQQISISYLF